MEEVKNIKSILYKSEFKEVKRIDPTNLIDPQVGRVHDTRGSSDSGPFLKRKIYMNAVEVACKPIKIPVKDSKEYKDFQRISSILIKATQSPNIIQFYGLSEID